MRIASQAEPYIDYEPGLGGDECGNRRFQRYVHRWHPTARNLQITCQELFSRAARATPTVRIRRGVLGGVPCIEGTRIPVYMILDALEHYGNLKAVTKSYPRLTLGQVKDSIRFAKNVLEVAVDDETAPSS